MHRYTKKLYPPAYNFLERGVIALGFYDSDLRCIPLTIGRTLPWGGSRAPCERREDRHHRTNQELSASKHRHLHPKSLRALFARQECQGKGLDLAEEARRVVVTHKQFFP